jgi:hypothetical protein
MMHESNKKAPPNPEEAFEYERPILKFSNLKNVGNISIVS